VLIGGEGVGWGGESSLTFKTFWNQPEMKEGFGGRRRFQGSAGSSSRGVSAIASLEHLGDDDAADASLEDLLLRRSVSALPAANYVKPKLSFSRTFDLARTLGRPLGTSL
jgi:hypothetical protein